VEEKTDVRSLISFCKKGKRHAQEELYRKFYAYALTVCMHYCYDRTEAEDVLIEGFYKVFKHLKQFDEQRDFKPWLRKLMVNAAIDHHRKYNKLGGTEELLSIEETSIEYNGLDKLQYDDLLSILQQLPSQYRLVFNLYEMEGFSHQEIAQQLGIGISTSKSNLSRAKQKLRKAVEVYGVMAKRKGT
jgi:RNA polymerase sigma factor (sigma-70 family)